jgi:hypothetical protein
MALEDINPDRGLIQKPLPHGGPLISMCKTAPGIFFDASGNPTSDETAAAAGFDVKALKRLRAKNTALEEQRKKIEAQFADDSKALEEEFAGDGPGQAAEADQAGDGQGTEGAPFIEKTKGGDPRVARTVQDGPVKEMEYVQQDRGWKVTNRDTNEILDESLEEADAIELLLAE